MREVQATQREASSDPVLWLDRHGDALFRFAMLRVKDRSVAEDLVQECFVAALGGLESFAGASTERTWLIGILKRKIVDHLRRSSRDRGGDATEQAETDVSPFFSKRGHWSPRPRACRYEPSTLMESQEFRAVVRHCLDGLSSRLAEAFLLRELTGIQAEEVCKVLDVTPTNLWARLHRARLGLRQCLESNWFFRTGKSKGIRDGGHV